MTFCLPPLPLLLQSLHEPSKTGCFIPMAGIHLVEFQSNKKAYELETKQILGNIGFQISNDSCV